MAICDLEGCDREADEEYRGTRYEHGHMIAIAFCSVDHLLNDISESRPAIDGGEMNEENVGVLTV